MNSVNKFCRLCAESKHRQKQVDLQSDSEKRQEIIEKLTRINALTEFSDTRLPSTVCLDCIRSLDNCFKFVVSIEYAQYTISEIISEQNVKMEYQSDGTDDEVPLEKDEHSESEVKIEQVDIKIECTKDEVKMESDSLDSFPLSQLKQTWRDYDWLCTYCETRFENIDDLQIHAMAVHSVCNPYRCTHCKVRKQCLDKFLVHIQRHNKHLKYSCYKCFKQFSTVANAKKHRTSHVDKDLYCSGCNNIFKTNNEHKEHVETYYRGKRNVDVPQISVDGQTCLICSKTFATKGNVKLHILRMHKEREKNHICHVCGKAFYDKFILAEHVLFVHTDYRPHKCQICNLGFKTTKSLKEHVGRHYNEKPLACDKCGKSFRLKKHLSKHSVMHTDGLPFQCNYCKKRFQRKQYLKNHLMQHTGERPYSCEACVACL
ncbi:Uncharacterized protein OBRU01_08704 [Operophtera brumata]|uniref:Uncharacterized protein n=1 Tax=Operophtera brumata TaxID=104452 RepID=A0A0L7LHP3_OPEBR|nr:Uncharacterized protein OBRU01_08704 [Operophtera brumata]